LNTVKKIKTLIAQGENIAVEFKREDVSPESIAKEMVAFANSSGGNILIGVEDDGVISGISTTKLDEAWVTNIARNNVVPSLDVLIHAENIDSKNVLLVEIPKGKNKPYQTNKYQFLIRVGSTNRVATQWELLRLFQQGGVFHFDKAGVEKTDEKVLNYTKVDNYFNLFNIQFDAEPPEKKTTLLKNANILTEEGQLTIAGLLCFGLNPARYLFQSGITVAHFRGNILTDELIDRQIIEGTLDYVIDTTLAVIKNNIRVPSIIVGAKREETPPPYSDKVLREILTNACAHRDYSIVGSQIRVFLFDDRLEVHSPGRLPNSVNVENIKVGVSYARNPVIVNFLIHLRYIDRFGRGIPMVLQEAAANNRQVNMEESGEEFVVTLYY
jgi:ATP-dependent DNA helicase RecG